MADSSDCMSDYMMESLCWLSTSPDSLSSITILRNYVSAQTEIECIPITFLMGLTTLHIERTPPIEMGTLTLVR